MKTGKHKISQEKSHVIAHVLKKQLLFCSNNSELQSKLIINRFVANVLKERFRAIFYFISNFVRSITPDPLAKIKLPSMRIVM
jgi:hypothetical protein